MPAAIFSLELSIPGIRKGTLFGGGKVPVRIINLGILTIVTINGAHIAALREFCHQGVDLDEWMIDRAPEIRRHKKRATAKARAQARAEFFGQAEHWREAHKESLARAAKAEQENYRLRTALEAIANLKSEAA